MKLKKNGKLMRKYYIFIAALGVLTAVFIIGGLSLTGSPFSEKLIKLDQQRLNDFNTIKYAIENYYRDKKVLPVNLRILPSNIKLSDPKSGKEYDFAVISSTQYKLCTEFSADTEKSGPERGVIYSNSSSSTSHRKGYDCISYSIPSYAMRPTPTPYRSPASLTMTTLCPGSFMNDECILPNGCLDSDGLNYFKRGSITYSNPTGEGLITLFDKCIEGLNQVEENYCNPKQPEDSFEMTGNRIVYEPDVRIYQCAAGYECRNGACVVVVTD
ncbi:hypothetical protein A2777_03075 [Candidatus Gottesmanbacteria bacterium RIFCSPHIGHO2_01_FULL_40_15]|uniref:Type II secretion system protein GspG C-terminal domain-containing protein n=1 Tax=Candidatus Gottesmanbacteria bacterium RIFCSPHIGHO2_01_FULL_40_15 TaxID=1798376 RepID=A0A1F5Z7I9_9BACT|nr:MAG: hypothetical protein A2777_03075 [Candidatus Gottesmanbacteria bacterium RIFCSPHIGHO2_01_FULL_40_15]